MIKINGLSKTFKKQLVINDLSVQFNDGEKIALIGQNGAGKTTLIRILLGFLKPDRGSGEVLGMDIETRQLEIHQRVGYMPEGDCFVPGMSAVRFVAYAGQLCGMPAKDAMQRSHEMLQYVGMDEERYRMVETYSAGMKQRIKLAQALIHDPELLLLDEPTTGMDPAGREEMLNLIKDISTTKGIQVMVSSHLLPDIEYACQDVIVMQEGKVVMQGNIEEMKNARGKAFDVKIKGEKQALISALEKHGFEWHETERGMLRVLLPEEMRPRIFFQIAASHGIQIRHLVATRHSLEDIFVEAVGEK